jgi:hypothetical protein
MGMYRVETAFYVRVHPHILFWPAKKEILVYPYVPVYIGTDKYSQAIHNIYHYKRSIP